MRIKNSNIKNAVVFNNENKTLVLFEGAKVKIITDESEFEKNIIGCIEWVTVDRIKIEGFADVPFEYIEEINTF